MVLVFRSGFVKGKCGDTQHVFMFVVDKHSEEALGLRSLREKPREKVGRRSFHSIRTENEALTTTL